MYFLSRKKLFTASAIRCSEWLKPSIFNSLCFSANSSVLQSLFSLCWLLVILFFPIILEFARTLHLITKVSQQSVKIIICSLWGSSHLVSSSCIECPSSSSHVVYFRSYSTRTFVKSSSEFYIRYSSIILL